MQFSREQLTFVAVLVFGDKDVCVLESRPFKASHPEIAYRLAVVSGQLKDYGREFLGLNDLNVQDASQELAGVMKRENAAHRVIKKEELPIFRDHRWCDIPYDPTELEQALSDPPVLVELPGLDDIDWHRLQHAYGSAKDVPYDLKRLASTDGEAGQVALHSLYASILHQGDVYDSTVFAVPFLFSIAEHETTPHRLALIKFLSHAAESAHRIQDDLHLRENETPEECKRAGDQYGVVMLLLNELTNRIRTIQSWQVDNHPTIINAAREFEAILAGPPPTPCPRCGRPLASALAKQCFICGADWYAR